MDKCVKINGGSLPLFCNLYKKQNNMKRRVKPETITNAKNFLNAVRGKHLDIWEVDELLDAHKCRKGLHLFARDCNYAQKTNGKWLFNDIEYQPIHARKVVERANDYQKDLREKNKLKNQKLHEPHIEWDMDELIDPVKNDASNDFTFRDIENEKKFKELYSEIDMLRKMIKSYQELLVLSTMSQELQEKRLKTKK